MRTALGIAALLCAAALGSPPALAAGEPETVDAFVALDPSDGHPIALERQAPSRGLDPNLGGFAAIPFERIEGVASPVRFKQGLRLEFLVKPADTIDLRAPGIRFEKARVAGGARRLASLAEGALTHIRPVPFHAAPYRDAYVRLTPDQPLGPGEYCLSAARTRLDQAPAAYCFGVDGN